MLVWRLVRPDHAPGLDGEGARLFGGRWNSPGVPIVYCAASLALAVLECFVHLPPAMRAQGRLPQLESIGLDVPDHAVLSLQTPRPGEKDLAQRLQGDTWAQSGASLGLAVPSRIMPREQNILLNPAHPAMAQVMIRVREPFVFEHRLAG